MITPATSVREALSNPDQEWIGRDHSEAELKIMRSIAEFTEAKLKEVRAFSLKERNAYHRLLAVELSRTSTEDRFMQPVDVIAFLTLCQLLSTENQ